MSTVPSRTGAGEAIIIEPSRSDQWLSERCPHLRRGTLPSVTYDEMVEQIVRLQGFSLIALTLSFSLVAALIPSDEAFGAAEASIDPFAGCTLIAAPAPLQGLP